MSAPAPLTSPDCDLRGMPFMPLDVVRLIDSDLFALSTGDEFKAAVALWCKSWLQVPAGSLPDDDRILAYLSTAGMGWRTVKDIALRGWVKCKDGRLYHPVIAEKAEIAWKQRKLQREKANKRWNRNGGTGVTPGGGIPPAPAPASNGIATAVETPSTGNAAAPQNDAAACATAHPTAHAAAMQGRGTVKLEVEVEVEEESKSRVLRTLGRSRAAKSDPAFDKFYAAYPRKKHPDDAHKAWTRLIRHGETVENIMEGLVRHQFTDDRNFIPYPEAWLNSGAYKEYPEDLPAPPSNVHPFRKETFSEERTRRLDEMEREERQREYDRSRTIEGEAIHG